jgi:hypothetical protein
MRTTWPAVAVAIAALGVGACGSSDYPAKAQRAFLSGCTESGGNETACRCALKKLQDAVPYADFLAADQAIRRGDRASPVVRKIREVSGECRHG